MQYSVSFKNWTYKGTGTGFNWNNPDNMKLASPLHVARNVKAMINAFG